MFVDNVFTMNEDDRPRMVAGWLPYQVGDTANHVTRYGLAMLEWQASAVLSFEAIQNAHEAWVAGDNFTEACQWLADWVDHAQDKFALHDERQAELEALVKAFDAVSLEAKEKAQDDDAIPDDNLLIVPAKAVVKWLLNNVHHVTNSMLSKASDAVTFATQWRVDRALEAANNPKVSVETVAKMARWAFMSNAMLQNADDVDLSVLEGVTRALLMRNRQGEVFDSLMLVTARTRLALSGPAYDYVVVYDYSKRIASYKRQDEYFERKPISFDPIPFTFVGDE